MPQSSPPTLRMASYASPGAGPADSRGDLIREFLPLARRLAMRYRRTSESIEDLTQVAYVGLVLAADRYDPEQGTSFQTYAIPTILGELRRHIRDHGWAVHVSRSLQENVLRMTSADDDARARLRRPPTSAEVATEAGLEHHEVIEASRAMSAYEADSLDRPVDHEDAAGEPMIATLGQGDGAYDLVEDRMTIQPGMAELTDLEQAVLAMRFFEDVTQSEIATRLGVSQMQVSRVLRRALDQLHEAACKAA